MVTMQERILLTKIQVFWHVTPCQFLNTYCYFEGNKLPRESNTCRIAHAHQGPSFKKIHNSNKTNN